MNSQTVQHEKKLIRDTNSNAILNVDLQTKIAIMKDREQRDNIANIQTMLLSLQVDVNEIKSMLQKIASMPCCKFN